MHFWILFIKTRGNLIVFVREFINRCFACMKAWQYTRKLCRTENGFVG